MKGFVSSTLSINQPLYRIGTLTYVRINNVRQRVNYAELGVEELGSVYESLLNYTLKLAEVPTQTEDWIIPAGHVFLSPLTTERKDLGAFYTKPELVDFVLSVSLDRLIGERLAAAGTGTDERGGALLNLRVYISGLQEEGMTEGPDLVSLRVQNRPGNHPA